MEEISFVSLGYVYQLRLAKKFVTKKRLEALFALQDIILITRDGDEVEYLYKLLNAFSLLCTLEMGFFKINFIFFLIFLFLHFIFL
jgi:hypothetical protein